MKSCNYLRSPELTESVALPTSALQPCPGRTALRRGLHGQPRKAAVRAVTLAQKQRVCRILLLALHRVHNTLFDTFRYSWVYRGDGGREKSKAKSEQPTHSQPKLAWFEHWFLYLPTRINDSRDASALALSVTSEAARGPRSPPGCPSVTSKSTESGLE